MPPYINPQMGNLEETDLEEGCLRSSIDLAARRSTCIREEEKQRLASVHVKRQESTCAKESARRDVLAYQPSYGPAVPHLLIKQSAMANSIYVPLDQLPGTLAEIQSIVGEALAEFDLPAPSVKLHRDDVEDALLNTFVLVAATALEHNCWLSFSDLAGQTEVANGSRYMVGVQTRDSWTFAGMVALGFCRYANSQALDDACSLGGPDSYSAEALHAALGVRLQNGVPHEARRKAYDLALDRDFDAAGVVEEEIFDALDLAYWYDSAATVGWVEARLRVLAGRLDRGESLLLYDPEKGQQIVVASRAEFNRWATAYFPVVGELIRAE